MPVVEAMMQSQTERAGKGDFLKLAQMLLRHKTPFACRQMAQVERCTERVVGILKSTVTAATISDWSSIADYTNIVEAFTQSLRTASVFDAALNDGMVRAPSRSRGLTVTTGIVGAVTGEGQAKVISSLALGSALLEPKKAAAIIVASKELADSPGASALFNAELTKGVVAATDNLFLSSLIAATTPTGSAGATLANVTSDFDTLLSAITTSATSRIYYVTSPTNMKGIVTKATAGGQPAYPIGPNGGELFPGVIAIASDQISSSAALMFAADAIVGDSDTIRLDTSDAATLDMSTTPDSPSVAATVRLSLWQQDLKGIRAERFFCFSILRASGIASLSGVAY
jgi:HK97 family phage major capsid protein